MLKKLYFLMALLGAMSFAACGDDDGDNGGGSGGGGSTTTITVSTTSLNFDGNSGSQTVTVTTDHEWAASASESWITVSPTSSTSANTTLTVTVQKNGNFDGRQGKVTIMSGAARAYITVSQEGGDGVPDPSEITCPLPGYTLVWNDEFDSSSSSLDASHWTHEVQGSGWVNNELQNYVKEKTPDGSWVTRVRNGVLSIRCLKENGKIYSGRVYANLTSGWTYGYFEAKIKLPVGKGTWPAYWMMPCNNNYSTNPWPGCGEIDIMEEVGVDAGWVSSTIHCTRYNNGNTSTEHGSKYLATAESDYHVYGCEWTSTYLEFFVDGESILKYEPSSRTKDYWPFNVPFYPILNLAWGGSWGGYKGVDDSALPVTMDVEYVRVFQKSK